jgi:hypothetical protein
MAAGEAAQRIHDLPKVQDLLDRIMTDATEIVKNIVGRLSVS